LSPKLLSYAVGGILAFVVVDGGAKMVGATRDVAITAALVGVGFIILKKKGLI